MIHLFYTGYGWLVFALTFGASLVANLLTNHFMDERYYDTHKWPLGAALFIAGSLCNIVVAVLNHGKTRKMLDLESGKIVELHRHQNTFFFIPMKWWGIILMIIGGFLAIRELF